MLKPVYALVGTDLFLHLENLKAILAQAPRDVQRIDLEGESAALADALDELRSFAMFSSAKVVIIREAQEFITRFREPLEHYVANPSGGSALVLRTSSLDARQRIHKLIAKGGEIVNCNSPDTAAIPAWIVNRAKTAHKLSIGLPEATLLADLLGRDLGRIDSELAKLALQTDGKVDAASISRNIAFQREQEMYDMTDEVAAGNIKSALGRWRHLVQLDNSAEYRATVWLTMWLEKARKALALRKRGVNEYQIAKDLKIWPQAKQAAFFRNIAALGEGRIGRLIELLTELDLRSKSGLGDMADNIEKFILAAR